MASLGHNDLRFILEGSICQIKTSQEAESKIIFMKVNGYMAANDLVIEGARASAATVST